MSRVWLGAPLVVSMTSVPSDAPSTTPSSPSSAVATSSERGNEQITVSALVATSRACGAHRALGNERGDCLFVHVEDDGRVPQAVQVPPHGTAHAAGSHDPEAAIHPAQASYSRGKSYSRQKLSHSTLRCDSSESGSLKKYGKEFGYLQSACG